MLWQTSIHRRTPPPEKNSSGTATSSLFFVGLKIQKYMPSELKSYTVDQTPIKRKGNFYLCHLMKMSIPFVLKTLISQGLYIVLAPTCTLKQGSFNFDFQTLLGTLASFFVIYFTYKLLIIKLTS